MFWIKPRKTMALLSQGSTPEAQAEPAAKPQRAGLTACRTCGNSIAKKAYSCPHCGEPIRRTILDQTLVVFWMLFFVSLAVAGLGWILTLAAIR